MDENRVSRQVRGDDNKVVLFGNLRFKEINGSKVINMSNDSDPKERRAKSQELFQRNNQQELAADRQMWWGKRRNCQK